MRCSPVPIAACLLLSAAPLIAQNPQVGSLRDAGCAQPPGWDVDAANGFFLLVDSEHPGSDAEAHLDWQAHFFYKGAGGVGMALSDLEGDSYQVLWSSPGLDDVSAAHGWSVHAFVTQPDGGLLVDSLSFPELDGPAAGFYWMGTVEQQRVGDSPAPPRSLTAGIVLPDGEAPYEADLGSGPESFPRQVGGWPEIAFAPIVELAGETLGECTLGGESLSARTGRSLIIGYNVHRMPDAGSMPAAATIAQPQYWLDFVPLDAGPWSAPLLSELSDPDGSLHTGDEALLYRDAPRSRDGRPRPHGSAPGSAPGERYWYAFSPVVEGELDAWSAVSLAGGPVQDHRWESSDPDALDFVDFDLDGTPDLIAYGHDHGLRGLTLTNDSLPVLSRLVLVEPAGLDSVVGGSLELGPGGLLTWASVAPAFRIRRAARPDFLRERPLPSLDDLLAETSAPSLVDDELPGEGRVFYYHVSAMAPDGRELGD